VGILQCDSETQSNIFYYLLDSHAIDLSPTSRLLYSTKKEEFRSKLNPVIDKNFYYDNNFKQVLLLYLLTKPNFHVEFPNLSKQICVLCSVLEAAEACEALTKSYVEFEYHEAIAMRFMNWVEQHNWYGAVKIGHDGFSCYISPIGIHEHNKIRHCFYESSIRRYTPLASDVIPEKFYEHINKNRAKEILHFLAGAGTKKLSAKELCVLIAMK
jgi:hypothetical protein